MKFGLARIERVALGVDRSSMRRGEGGALNVDSRHEASIRPAGRAGGRSRYHAAPREWQWDRRRFVAHMRTIQA
jgi:hypothetical protein